MPLAPGYRPYYIPYEWIPSRCSQTHDTLHSSANKTRQPATISNTARNKCVAMARIPGKTLDSRTPCSSCSKTTTTYEFVDKHEQIFTDHVNDYLKPHLFNVTVVFFPQLHSNNHTNMTPIWCSLRSQHVLAPLQQNQQPSQQQGHYV